MCSEILSKTKSLYSKSCHICLNTFTLHFPIKNVLQSTQSSLKWSLVSKTRGRLRTLWRHGCFEHIHSSFPDQKRFPEYPIFSEMKSPLNSLKAWLALNTFTLQFPIENVPQRTQSSLKWSLLWNSWSSSHTSKVWLALNTFTLHLPIENILQSTQSSLKWDLIWNEVFS